MTITINLDDKLNQVLVSIVGAFNFSTREEFRKIIGLTNSNRGLTYRLDLGKVTEIDSSAIGMIMLLSDLADGVSSKIEITEVSAVIKDDLELTQISSLMKAA